MAHICIAEGAEDVDITFRRPGHVPTNVTLGGQALVKQGQAWRRNGTLGPGAHEIVADGIDEELGAVIAITTARTRGQGQGGGQGQGNQP